MPAWAAKDTVWKFDDPTIYEVVEVLSDGKVVIKNDEGLRETVVPGTITHTQQR